MENKKKQLVEVWDDEGQMTFLDPKQNYFPVAADYTKIPNRFIEKYANVSYLANLGLMLAINKLEARVHSTYVNTQEGQFYENVYKKTGTDYSDGLVAEFPIAEFIKLFELNSGGRTYKKIDELFNGEQMRNQWQILYEDDEICAGTSVLTGTMYNKKNKQLYLKFNQDLAPVITNIKSDYAQISLPVLGKLKDDFVSSLYQLLKKRHDYEDSRNRKYGLYNPKEKKITIELDHLYFLTGLYPVDLTSGDRDMQKVVQLLKIHDFKLAAEVMHDSGLVDRYGSSDAASDNEKNTSRQLAVKEFSYFRKRYLDKAFKRINGFVAPKNLERIKEDGFEEAFKQYEKQCHKTHPSDIHFRYEFTKKGHGGKITAITFYVSKADWTSSTMEKEADEKPAEKNLINKQVNIGEMDFLISMKDIIKEKVTSSDLRAIAEASEWNITKIEKAYKVAEASIHDIPNITGFLIAAIKEEWKAPEINKQEIIDEQTCSMDFIKGKMFYDDVLLMHPSYKEPLDMFITVIFDLINNTKKTVKINQGSMKKDIVVDRILSLNSMEISNAIYTFLEAKSEVVTDNYIISILYNIRKRQSLKIDQTIHADFGIYPEYE